MLHSTTLFPEIPTGMDLSKLFRPWFKHSQLRVQASVKNELGQLKINFAFFFIQDFTAVEVTAGGTTPTLPLLKTGKHTGYMSGSLGRFDVGILQNIVC